MTTPLIELVARRREERRSTFAKAREARKAKELERKKLRDLERQRRREKERGSVRDRLLKDRDSYSERTDDSEKEQPMPGSPIKVRTNEQC